MYVKVSEFNAELEQEAQTLIKKENKSYSEFYWGLLSLFSSFYFKV